MLCNKVRSKYKLAFFQSITYPFTDSLWTMVQGLKSITAFNTLVVLGINNAHYRH